MGLGKWIAVAKYNTRHAFECHENQIIPSVHTEQNRKCFILWGCYERYCLVSDSAVMSCSIHGFKHDYEVDFCGLVDTVQSGCNHCRVLLGALF